jgi:hypothetical protein
MISLSIHTDFHGSFPSPCGTLITIWAIIRNPYLVSPMILVIATRSAAVTVSAVTVSVTVSAVTVSASA